MIEARSITKRFGGRSAVEDVSLRVSPGEVVGFLGPNGAGKSTTMRMLLGLLRPTAGSVAVDGAIGYLPEAFSAYDAMSVRAYVRFMARMKRSSSDEVERVLAATDTAELAGRPFGRLSKGQRQRVGLAQALLGSPPNYVLDEPTQGLDPGQVVAARGLIRSLAESGSAVLLSTHLLNEAAAICDRVVVIARGRVLAEERPADTPDLEARFLSLVARAELA